MIEVRAQMSMWSFAPRLLILDHEKGKAKAARLIFEDIRDGECLDEYAFSLDSSEVAQQLMDDLWRCGLRPSEGTGSAGALAAVKYHLEDMRKIVFERKV
jgi:hypothetical protein